MKINDIKQESNKIVCSVTLEDAEWSDNLNKEKIKASKNVKVPGFRKGKVPEKEALKHVNMEPIMMRVANDSINNALKKIEENEELKKINKDVYPTPTVDIKEAFDLNHLSFEVTYWIMPKVTIDDYKNLDVDIKKVVVDDKEVDEEINAILDKEKMLTKKEDKTIAKGDQANFDFIGYIDGKEFPGGKAEKFDLEIGSERFIPGFEDQMIGMKEGDEKEIKVTFPKDYHDADKANKEATFKLKINEVFSVSRPTLTEEIIKGLNLPDKDIKTPEQFRKFLKENMQKYYENRDLGQNIQKINEAIYKRAKYDEIPEIMISDEVKELNHQIDAKLQQMGIKREKFIEMSKQWNKDIEKETEDQAKQNCVVYGALDYIIDKEKLDISDKEIEEKLDLIAKSYNKPVDEIKGIVSNEALKESLLHEKAIMKLIEWNTK